MEAARFLFVGALCAVLHNAIMIGGDRLGWHYVLSTFVSLFVVGLIGYWAHSRWTYSDAQRSGASLVRYYAMASANLPLSLAGMFVMVDALGAPVFVAAPVVTVALAVWNYLGNRWALKTGKPRHG